MIDIAKMRVIINNKLYSVLFDSYDECVTLIDKMKLFEPHLLFVEDYLCTVFVVLSAEGEMVISFKLNMYPFVTKTALTITVAKDTPTEASIRIEKLELVNALNIVDILYELNAYFNALKGLPTIVTET